MRGRDRELRLEVAGEAGGPGLAGALILALCLALAGPVAAEEGEPPQVPLGQLLKLPSTMPLEGAAVERKGGATRQTWIERFRKARADVEETRAAVAASRAALEEVASQSGGQWTMSAPGLGSGASTPSPGEVGGSERPLDFALSQEIKRHREEAERAERRLQELEVEANLAGVPDSWRSEPAAAVSADGRVEPAAGARQEREGW